MAGKHGTRGGAAVKTRLSLPRPALLALLGAALLGLLLLAVLRPGRARREEAQPAAPVSVPAAAGVPDAAALPEAAREVPARTAPELSVRAALKRDGFPLLRWDVERFGPDEQGRMRYAGEASTRTGVDVSEHQYDIDWDRVAADGVDFAMIRLGYRGSTAGGLYIDEYFERNMAGARKAGLPVGVYFYSQAVTVEEAREEAAFVLDKLKGWELDYPVVFDWEIVGGADARTYTVSRRTLCDCARAFCETVKAEGYRPMIYFTQYLGYRKYILRNLADYGFWYAEYEPQPRFAYDFDMWQYSDTGKVDGIDGEVDLNLYFVS